MFSKELESLIEATLVDGVIAENEKAALLRRAEREGVDADELQIYIDSIRQKKVMNEQEDLDRQTATHERERRGTICPGCGTPIPPLSKTCPVCGRVVAEKTEGEKELLRFVDEIEQQIVKVRMAEVDDFEATKTTAQQLLNKADMYYGRDSKVQAVCQRLRTQIQESEKAYQLKKPVAAAGKATNSLLTTVLVLVLGFLGMSMMTSGSSGLGFVCIGIAIAIFATQGKKNDKKK